MENKKVIPSGPRGFEFWKETLKGARMVVAPMVDASELAWRMMSRRYGAELCYTPMLHATVFVKDARYRRENLVTCPEDRPLIVQFCANDPDTFKKACQLAAPYCDAIDLNLGCPQSIAKKGRYGAFLMNEWTLIADMIKMATSKVDIPITAKIRIFPHIDMTVAYAKMLERAGVSLLTVHGRTMDQKGALTGIADWSYIKKVRESVNIPVFANGNIQYLSDFERCIEETGVQGVMSAEGNLHNPAIFKGQSPLVWDAALEYMELVQQYPCPLSFVRGHVFKIMYHCFNMPENVEIRYQMSKASTVEIMIEVTNALKNKMMDYIEKKKEWIPPQDSPLAYLPFPPWMCQPYVRIPAEEHMKRIAEGQRKAAERDEFEMKNGIKRLNPDGSKIISNKKLKRMKRNPFKNFDKPPFDFDKCPCSNPREEAGDQQNENCILEDLEEYARVFESTMPSDQDTCTSFETSPIQSTPKNTSLARPQKRSKDKCDFVLETIEQHFKKPRPKEDRFDVLGKAVGLKMRDITNNVQRLLAEKIINEALFMAEMDQLTSSHSIRESISMSSASIPTSQHFNDN